MSICKLCEGCTPSNLCNFCVYGLDTENREEKEVQTMTNFEHIKNMNIDELAYFIDSITEACVYESCGNCPININECDEINIKNWLNEEVKKC
ncbi:MAG: hypothetical protein ACI4VF_05275 [Lachnospirales bacterium]